MYLDVSEMYSITYRPDQKLTGQKKVAITRTEYSIMSKPKTLSNKKTAYRS